MTRRTPQEIADFLGCYIAQDVNQNWWAYIKKPFIGDRMWFTSDGVAIANVNFLIETPEDHVWTKLYIPNVSENPTGSTVSEMENVEGISEKETAIKDSEKIEQASDSYIVVYYDCLEGLVENVNAYLSEGYVLCGNLVVDSNEFYQPMIKYKR